MGELNGGGDGGGELLMWLGQSDTLSEGRVTYLGWRLNGSGRSDLFRPDSSSSPDLTVDARRGIQ